MLRGKKPDSTHIKLVKGNERSGRVNYNEPLPPTPEGPLIKPKMQAAAARVWDELAPMLEEQGILTVNDMRACVRLCYLEAEFAADPYGFTSAKLTELRRLEELFGMAGPSSRARLRVEPKNKAKKQSKAAGHFD